MQIDSCPFCRKEAGEVYFNSAHLHPWHVQCCACGAEGPGADGKEEAVIKWNTRDEMTDEQYGEQMHADDMDQQQSYRELRRGG